LYSGFGNNYRGITITCCLSKLFNHGSVDISDICWSFKVNESYGSVNSHGLWACANILTPQTGTGQIRNTIALLTDPYIVFICCKWPGFTLISVFLKTK
jgi:hypothetical protein